MWQVTIEQAAFFVSVSCLVCEHQLVHIVIPSINIAVFSKTVNVIEVTGRSLFLNKLIIGQQVRISCLLLHVTSNSFVFWTNFISEK
jgi:hypothetical protein